MKRWSGLGPIGSGTGNLATVLCMGAANAGAALAGPADVKFSQSAPAVDVYDFVEVVLNVERPDVANPFTDAVVAGEFAPEGGEAVRVDGFCDAADGSVFRVRFMPTRARRHTYSVEYQDGAFQASYSGEFTARDAGRRGLVRVDPEYPWHFIWEGTGEHYFYNGTTAYWLVGWDDENIRRNLDRLHSLQVTRVRSALMGRVQNGRAWYENVFPTEEFSFLLNPWVAERPDSVEQPGFDVTRFNVAHWQKYERLLRHARGLDMVVSVIIYVDGRRPGVDPFGKAGAGGDDEQRYYRYAVARFAAFSNVMWDVTNEYQLFRDEAWADKMGALIKQCDPYDHLASVHGHGTFHFRTSPWADFAMYQRWDQAGGYRFLRAHRDEQAKTGRIIPQVNEEYGYEDHYPRWGGNRKAPARVADNRRRLAWEMYMAGCYQTTGERADTGTGWGPDTGGGWVNGRGDDSMTMLRGYGRIVDFFTSIPWWTLEPDDELIDAAQGDAANVALSHITYTRTAAGQATMYLDGAEIATATIAGDVSNWDDGYRLLLANELTKDRPWLGEYRRVAVYARPLSAGDVAQSFEAGLDRGTSDAVALYAFGERGGDVVRDSSGAGQPLHLTIDDGGAVRWLADGGLRIESPVLIASAEPATKLISAVEQSGAITIEAWVKPANTTQAGPARVVSLSADPGQRNFTLGQAEGAYEVRLRTTSTSANGEPSLWSPGRDGQPHPICASRSEDGDLAVVYFPAGGQVTVRAERLRDGLEARWYNPRTGEWSPAEGRGGTVYRTPDEEDWALLFRGE